MESSLAADLNSVCRKLWASGAGSEREHWLPPKLGQDFVKNITIFLASTVYFDSYSILQSYILLLNWIQTSQDNININT